MTQVEKLPDKVFITQTSPMTQLFRSKHFQAFEHLLVAAVIFYGILHYLENGAIFTAIQMPTTDLLKIAFVNWQPAIFAWFKLAAMTFTLYPIVKFWINHRPNVQQVTNFDRLFAIIYVAYQAGFVMVTFDILFRNPILGMAPATAISLEQVRLIAKMHSFVREVTRKIFAAKKDDDGSYKPTFSSFVYFLMAPTLIYRDHYPRNQSIRIRIVLVNFGQFFTACFVFYYLWDRYALPEFYAYQTVTKVTGLMMAKTIFRLFLPPMYLLFFFGFFQSWLNGWAELLRFSDRLFYRDWWAARNFSQAYRLWNLVVHDWLYIYVYKEAHELFNCGKSRVLPAILVFAVSSAFHEFVMLAMLKYFIPVMLFNLSIFSNLALYMKPPRFLGRLNNLVLWVAIYLLYGVFFSLYLTESAARLRCPEPDYDNSILATMVPRFLSCFFGIN